MLEVIESPLTLAKGDLIVAKLRAYNKIGWGDYSDPNTVGQVTELKPDVPTQAPVLLQQNESELETEMPEFALENTGGSPITSYNLQFDQGNATYVTIIGEAPDNLERTFNKGGLTTDVVYKFKYRVKNKYGWSNDFSLELSARTATIPEQVSGLSFQIQHLLNVRFSWDQPYHGGSPITSYTILFLNHDQDTFSTIDAYCDGT